MALKSTTIRLLLGIALATLPFVLHVAPTFFGRSVLFSSMPLFLATFMVCGVLCERLVAYWAALCGVAGAFLGMGFLTMIHFIGNGGDGDLFYAIGACGSVVFIVSALALWLLRWLFGTPGEA